MTIVGQYLSRRDRPIGLQDTRARPAPTDAEGAADGLALEIILRRRSISDFVQKSVIYFTCEFETMCNCTEVNGNYERRILPRGMP
jgi:hypothetical protein